MNHPINRRQFLEIAALGVVVFASGLTGIACAASQDFYFVQLSDVHWGFTDAKINPEFAISLQRSIAAVNKLKPGPDFVVFTGDLTQTTEDPVERRRRMREFREIARTLKCKDVRYLPGEHDATTDKGEAYQEFFGELHYSFDHKGIHFVVIDNVTNAALGIAPAQLEWLADDLAKHPKNTPIVVLTHRPLFELMPSWDWATRNGDKVIEMLMPFANVTVFYGHIHQLHEHTTGHIKHYAAESLKRPLPVAGSVPKKAAIPWDAAQPFRDLGYREVATNRDEDGIALKIKEAPLA